MTSDLFAEQLNQAATTSPTWAVAGAVTLFVLSAIGSIFGTGHAASAAIGAWKKCYAHNRPAPFTLLTFVGMALTNSLYGMVLMFSIIGKAVGANAQPFANIPFAGLALFALCVIAGLAIGLAAYIQARASACACDAQGETGQGFGNYIAAIGIIEGVTIFVFAFMLVVIGSFFTAAA